MTMKIRPFQTADEDSVIQLWHHCQLLRPWNDPGKDIQRKLHSQPELFLVGVLKDHVIASAMAGYDGHRGWVYYLAVDPRQQGNGYGKAIMEEVERLLKQRGCPKLKLQVRGDNLHAVRFYESIGYQCDDVVSFGKRLIPDR